MPMKTRLTRQQPKGIVQVTVKQPPRGYYGCLWCELSK